MNIRLSNLFQALASAVVLGSAQIIIIYFLIERLLPTWADLLASVASFVASVAILFWLGSLIPKLWKNSPGADVGKELSGAIGGGVAKWTAVVILGSVVFVSIVVAIFFPNSISFPVEQTITFVLSGVWFAYIFVFLHQLVSVEGGAPQHLARFAYYSVVGAIVLSVFFLMPIDEFTEKIFNLFYITAYGHGFQGKIVASFTSPAVLWLQSTAIPSIVALAFGVLVAYATSVVWYDFYEKVSKTGIRGVSASREGRDPRLDDFWYGSLQATKLRVVISGATLGGWFQKWERLRPALFELLGRETVQQVKIILPEPGGDAFWVRRDDEFMREKSLSRDPVSRLAEALETLYLMLPTSGSSDELTLEPIIGFLQEQKLKFDRVELEKFYNGFVHVFAKPRSKYYASDGQNAKFSQAVVSSLKSSELGMPPKLSIVFCRGTILSANIFDDKILLVHYLPNTEDKECPQFEIKRDSELGASLDRSIASMTSEGIQVQYQHEIAGMAFRLWARCQLDENKAAITGLSHIPVWLYSTDMIEGQNT